MELEKDYYASPRWSWEILDCAMPMTFDTYSNCAHQCVYCFAFFQRAIGQNADAYLHHKVKSVNVEKVKRMFTDPDQFAGQFAGYIKRRFVLQWGGMSDGFDWYERKFRKSLDLLRFFREIDYPVSISTKGTWFVDDPEYREVLKGATNTHWKYSIITDNPQHAKKLEAGTPPPAERFDAMRKLNELGVGATTLRYRPFVIGVSDLCVDSMVKTAKDIGCYSVTTEFLCIESRAGENHHQRYAAMSDVVGYDVFDFYKRNSFSGSGLLRLNYDLKRPYMDALKAASAKYDIPLFVSDAHHKEQSASAGCCGLPAEGPLSNYNKGQYAEAIQIARKTGQVKWSDISEKAEWLNEIPFGQAVGYNLGTTMTKARNLYHTMFDFMHDTWNKPKSWSSPARYFGGALVPSELDENGDIVYLYNEPYVERGEQAGSIIELKQKLAGVREQISADGADMGYVSFPIFIPTVGRYDTMSIAKVFDDARLSYTLVVEPHEQELYADRFPNADILTLPESGRGPAFSRQFILDHCRAEGLAWHWQFDDNIKGFKHKNKPTTARAALSFAESFVASYGNLALVSFDYQQFAFRVEKPFSVNKRNACSVLIYTGPGADYRAEALIKEDVDFQLQRLSQGMSTILVHDFSMIKPPMGNGGKGGCRPFYDKGQHNVAAQRLAELWPHTRLIEKPKGVDVRVDWKAFPNTLALL
jgi:DNA repair photolyase